MATPSIRPTGQAAAQVELLGTLGLPASASPEDIDQLHQAASEFLMAAPPELRGWARAQVAALDSAYIHLTDPVGLEGSALMSPASPPLVVPGGPATPPARRGPAPAVAPVAATAAVAEEADDLEIEGEPDVEDLAALYAMVTPSAHDDMKPRAKRARPAPAPVAARAAVPQAVPAPAGTNVWKLLFLGSLTAVLLIGVGFGANAIVNGTPAASPGSTQVAEASGAVPSVDEAKVAALMAKIQANPKDIESLLALGNEYYNGLQYETAATFFDKVLAIEPENTKGLLGRGAVYFNSNDTAQAETTWLKVTEIDPANVEAYYDLGFLKFYQPTPDYDAVQTYWGKVIELDPDSAMGKQVRAHLDALVMKSIIPAASAGASPAASAGASPAASPAASVVEQSAKDLAFATSQLSAPAGTPFTIAFNNQDALPHDIVVKDASGTEVFKGDLVTGPKTVEYALPALAAGTYTFTCSIHPTMTGTLKVGS